MHKGFSRLAPSAASLIRAVLLCACLLLSMEGATAGSLFNVANVHVDVTAQDAVVAREKGLAEAETKAMQTLLIRLVPLRQQSQLPTFSHSDVEGLVAGVAIHSEKTSATRYVGVVDVRFYPGAVRQFLASRSIPFVEAQASAISILPVMLEGDDVPRDANAGWKDAWDRLDLANGVAPATLVKPRDDLDARTVRAVLAGDMDAYASLRSAYGYGGLVVAAGEAIDGFLRVRLAGEDAAGPVDTVVTSALEPKDREATQDAAAQLSLSALERRWKKRLDPGFDEAAEAPLGRGALYPDGASARGYEALGRVGAIIEFPTVRDWQQIRFGLQRVDDLQDFEIVSRSTRAAEVVFDFDGSTDQLETLLAQNGIALYQREGTLVMRAR